MASEGGGFSWPVQVSRPEFDGVVRRVETLESKGEANAVVAADVAYLKRTVSAFREEVDKRFDSLGDQVGKLRAAEERDIGGEQLVARAIAIVGAMVGVAGVVVAIVAVLTQ